MRSQVNGFVNLAFKLVGDLADEITLISNNASDFDFNSVSAVMGGETTKVIKGIVELSGKSGPGLYDLKVLFKVADIPDPSLYDKAIVRGVMYFVTTPDSKEKKLKSNMYTQTIYLAKEKPNG